MTLRTMWKRNLIVFVWGQRRSVAYSPGRRNKGREACCAKTQFCANRFYSCTETLARCSAPVLLEVLIELRLMIALSLGTVQLPSVAPVL